MSCADKNKIYILLTIIFTILTNFFNSNISAKSVIYVRISMEKNISICYSYTAVEVDAN